MIEKIKTLQIFVDVSEIIMAYTRNPKYEFIIFMPL